MPSPWSPRAVVVLLAATIFLNMTSAMMLGPLLVELAHYFHTTVALTGQLAAASAITWALTAYLAGPLSDMYGRRRMMLSGLLLIIVGTFSAALAWSYGALLACRLLTGFGAALIPPNCIATVADLYPPERRGTAMGWVLSATGLGMAFGIPLVAWLTEIGGWRFPFYAVGLLLVILWGLLWHGLPRVQSATGDRATFVAHLKAVSTQQGFWAILIANGLQVMAYIGMSGYLAAYLIQTYGMEAGETAVPLSLAGLGVIAGSLVGGRVAGRQDRASVADRLGRHLARHGHGTLCGQQSNGDPGGGVVGGRDALARAVSVGRDVLFGDGHCRGGDHAVQSPESGGGTVTARDMPIRNTPALTVE